MTILEDGLLGGPVSATSGTPPAASNGPAVRVLNALVTPNPPSITGIGTVNVVADTQYTTLYVWAADTQGAATGYYKMTWRTPRLQAQVFVSGPDITLTAAVYDVVYAAQSASGAMGPYTRFTVRR